ncbi:MULTISPECIES: hypothetical protein [Streptomyces]|uniref:Uncharacterized protein n=1 Tax=Streptomyces sudanensis TaxID=436397 RepID=A0ABY4TFC3_9ACTN|nr:MULTISPECIES: hypothetical protein [Streptomyces]URN17437.1 hypothetical protein MW084_17565 [Streptomyces sudanensis]
MIIVRPDAYRQYPAGHSRFTLVLERRFSDDVRIEPPSRYETWDTVAVEPGRSLADVLRSDVPQDGDVLVVAEDDRLLTAPDSEVGPHRTVAALRAGTGPLALDQLGKLLDSLEKTDPGALDRTGDALGDALAAAGGLVVEEGLTGSVAKVAFAAPTWSRIDTGAFRPGTAQSAPTGLRRLDLAGAGTTVTGQIAVKGWSVVRTHEPDTAACRELFDKLSGLFHYPLVLTVENGSVADMKATEAGSATAAAALTQLFTADSGHAEVTGLEFGLNPAAPQLPFNSESNAAGTGRAAASVHLVLGAPPLTRFQVVLDCATSSLTALGGTTPLAGAATAPADRAPRRRMNRVTAANCGCH